MIYTRGKTDTGVSLEWMKGKRRNPGTFTFPKLDILRITVQDLIGYPVLFGIALLEHKNIPGPGESWIAADGGRICIRIRIPAGKSDC